MENSPLTTIATGNAARPAFEKTTGKVCDVPIATGPKSSSAGETRSSEVAGAMITGSQRQADNTATNGIQKRISAV